MEGICEKCNKVIITRHYRFCGVCDTNRPYNPPKEGNISNVFCESYKDLRKGMFDSKGIYSRNNKREYARSF